MTSPSLASRSPIWTSGKFCMIFIVLALPIPHIIGTVSQPIKAWADKINGIMNACFSTVLRIDTVFLSLTKSSRNTYANDAGW